MNAYWQIQLFNAVDVWATLALVSVPAWWLPRWAFLPASWMCAAAAVAALWIAAVPSPALAALASALGVAISWAADRYAGRPTQSTGYLSTAVMAAVWHWFWTGTTIEEMTYLREMLSTGMIAVLLLVASALIATSVVRALSSLRRSRRQASL